ncbi:porin family protein [Pedobacter deserti]|uniref:porin family protein n=1 Tax=Pedobacter deserti TaxID=2817382 RepID=UPI0021088275|nr:porin family protein [Pedobacter sp. SYSU D00382]
MKRIIVTCLTLFTTAFSYAQTASLPYGFRLGLTAHPTVGWIKPQLGKTGGVSIGFSYGLTGDFNFAQNYSFATALTITTVNGRSTEIRTTEGGGATPVQTAYDLKYMMQYIEVPLSIKLRTVKINDVRWYGQFGLSNGFKIGAKQDADISGSSEYRDLDVGKSTSFYRAGLLIGAGAEFDMGPQTSLTAGLSFNNGFTDITKSDNLKVRNHYIGINFGVLF